MTFAPFSSVSLSNFDSDSCEKLHAVLEPPTATFQRTRAMSEEHDNLPLPVTAKSYHLERGTLSTMMEHFTFQIRLEQPACCLLLTIYLLVSGVISSMVDLSAKHTYRDCYIRALAPVAVLGFAEFPIMALRMSKLQKDKEVRDDKGRGGMVRYIAEDFVRLAVMLLIAPFVIAGFEKLYREMPKV